MKRRVRRKNSQVTRRLKAQELLDGEVGALCVTRFMGADMPGCLPEVEHYAMARLKERMSTFGIHVKAGRAEHDQKLLTLTVQ